jgi:DNA-binding SARP family transcriptional activator
MHRRVERLARVRLWGEVTACGAAGTPLELTGRRARAVIALLASAQGVPVAREKIAGLLWSSTDAQARWNLRQLLYDLKPLAEPGEALIGAGAQQVRVRVEGADWDRLGGAALADPVPEPAALALFGLGGVALIAMRRRVSAL